MDIADARYVSLTTFRRSGEAVATPVWIAPLGDGRAGFTTDAASGKVKRIRHTPGVTLQECDMRGNVAHGTAAVTTEASLVADGPDRELVEKAVGTKYGIQFTLIELGGRLKRIFTKGEPPVAVVLTFPT
jgi:PPOX class probable F420-dependent enzyme